MSICLKAKCIGYIGYTSRVISIPFILVSDTLLDPSKSCFNTFVGLFSFPFSGQSYRQLLLTTNFWFQGIVAQQKWFMSCSFTRTENCDIAFFSVDTWRYSSHPCIYNFQECELVNHFIPVILNKVDCGSRSKFTISLGCVYQKEKKVKQ